MSFQRGDVVQHNQHKWIGVVESGSNIIGELFGEWRGEVLWFEGLGPEDDAVIQRTAHQDYITKIDGYAFEAALYLGETAKALELYHAEKKRMDGWQQHFQPLIDQYGAAEMAWIAGSIAAMVATGQFTPEDAIRHWQRPQAVVSGEPIFYGKSFAPEWVNDLERRFADKFRQIIQWPPPRWFVEGSRLITARQQLDALTGGLSDAEWQEILDYCADVANKSVDPDVFWKELSMWEIHARYVGGSKALMLEILRRAKGNG